MNENDRVERGSKETQRQARPGAGAYRTPALVSLGSMSELVQGTYACAPYRDRYTNYYKVIG
jgi:hypothetical protein